MPATVLFGMFAGLSIWVVFSRDPAELFGGFISGGGLLSSAAIVGALVLGHSGARDVVFELRQFVAIRPLSTSDLARTILKVAARSVFMAWAIWALAFLVAVLVLMATGSLPRTTFPSTQGWWYFPATLLGPWTVAAMGASIGLAGRPRLVVKLVCGAMALYFGLAVLSSYALSRETEDLLRQSIGIAMAVAFWLATIWVFVSARRRGLVGWPTVAASAAAWGLFATLLACAWVLVAMEPMGMIGCLFLIGLSSLTVAPLAAAPLALHWNRHQ